MVNLAFLDFLPTISGVWVGLVIGVLFEPSKEEDINSSLFLVGVLLG